MARIEDLMTLFKFKYFTEALLTNKVSEYLSRLIRKKFALSEFCVGDFITQLLSVDL